MEDETSDEECRIRSAKKSRKGAAYADSNREGLFKLHGYTRRPINKKIYEQPDVRQARQQHNILATLDHLAIIPAFDGDPTNLPLFEKMVRIAARTVDPNYKSFFVGALANRLEGKAAMYFAPRLAQFDTINELLKELKRRYGNIGNPEAELTKLRSVYQRKGENLESYCNRVELIFNRVLLLYDANLSLSPIQKQR